MAQEAPDAVRPTEVIALLKNKNLSEFTTWLKESQHEDPKQVFSFTEDGLLRISGDGYGYIRTNRDYRDYRLVAEFKWGSLTWGARKDRARDSGILVHCVGPDGNAGGTWMASIEYQIIEGGTGDFILVGGKYADGQPVPVTVSAETTQDRDGETVWKQGAERKTFTRGRINWFGRDPDWKDILGFRGAHDVEYPPGEWNRCEVVCEGGHIQAHLNGKLVNEAFDAFPAAGKILFQAEGAELFFRTIELHPLEK